MELPSENVLALVAQAVLLFAIVLVLCIGALHAVTRFRGRTEEDESSASRLMSNLREMHARGDVTEAEYRTIKTVLASQLEAEVKDNGEKG